MPKKPPEKRGCEKPPRRLSLYLKVRANPPGGRTTVPSESVWLVNSDGPAQSSLLHGVLVTGLAEQIAAACGLEVVREAIAGEVVVMPDECA